MDDTDSGTFVIFDRDASVLFNMSCADMIEGPARVTITNSINLFYKC
jgi:hypothetical protein